MAAMGRKKHNRLIILLSELYGRQEFAAFGTVAQAIGLEDKKRSAALVLARAIESDPTLPRELATRLVDANGLLKSQRRSAGQHAYTPADFLRDDDAFAESGEGALVDPASIVTKPKKLKKLLKERRLD
ncbi:hypothetical protein BRM1_10425 [Brevibacterium sp. BRM-1]|uniref:hypothetical protein n=1 Tax=Brevibacterium sp. BRM-1 TaxID=2999062 RepID=UPI0022812E3C|nr:hypothetical protein [Brevibacterium sp. BRM-1]WAL39671.1 hypothetical protein BRM1_10425 [Brevibacterium sp. BRM-1]